LNQWPAAAAAPYVRQRTEFLAEQWILGAWKAGEFFSRESILQRIKEIP
jgi:hypothetical protein